VAQQKRVWSSLSHPQNDQKIDGEEAVFRWMFAEVEARREPWQPLVCVMDGQPSLGLLVRVQLGTAGMEDGQ